MNEKDQLVVHRKLDRRVLVLLTILIAIAVLAISTACSQSDQSVQNVQNDQPPTTNDDITTPPGEASLSQPVTVPDVPEGQDPNLVYTTNDEWVPLDSLALPSAAAPENQAISSPVGAVRHVYLTNLNYYPDQALAACGSGYHMASLWEIHDVSNLVYDRQHPAAHNKADSGYGPPSYWHGWVRTGWASSASQETGTGNCNNWSSRSAGDYGVSVRLSRTWEAAPGDTGPWDANSFACSITGPVWCVKD